MYSPSNVTIRFVATPFLPEHQPALGVSSLSAVLKQHGISSDIRYLNIDYAAYIGEELHKFITTANPPNFLVGEMIFAEALWGRDDRLWREYEEKILKSWEDPAYVNRRPKNLEFLLASISRLRSCALTTVQRWALEILADMPRIVGFTSTFQQNMASLALAKELRRQKSNRELTILFGGANCEGDMGRAIAENFPFVDHVVSGEGESAILNVVNAATAEKGAQARNCPRWSTGPMVQKIDDLPIPDFQDYFAAIKKTNIGIKINLVAESSRGCWWGMKSHCTFCGLNGQTMQFRSKEPRRFAEELRTLSRLYGPTYFAMADNILDIKYIARLFPDLISTNESITLFYETKANLRREQLKLMAAGGIVRLQPGIESLSTSILRLMGKGTSCLQNVQLLKWCKEYDIEVAWNLLYGFPNEPPEEYAKIAGIIPALRHLPPPIGSGQVRIDRFSPYWRSPQDFGISNLRHFWAYDYVYSGIPIKDRINFAYYFDFDHPTLKNPTQYCIPMLRELDSWRETSKQAMLEITQKRNGIVVKDTRGLSDDIETLLTPEEAAVLKYFDACHSRTNCMKELIGLEGKHSASTLAHIIDAFLERKWLIADGDQLLSLVIDRSRFEEVIEVRTNLQLEFWGLGDTCENVPNDASSVQAFS